VIDQIELEEVVAFCKLRQWQIEVAGDGFIGSFIELIQGDGSGIAELRPR